jgi:hypothetical protein
MSEQQKKRPLDDVMLISDYLEMIGPDKFFEELCRTDFTKD